MILEELTEQQMIQIAKTVYAEGAVFSGKNQDALLAIAQCIHDLLPQYNTLTECLTRAFTRATDEYDENCCQAVLDVFEFEKRRFDDAKILQFRSFTKYSDGDGNPDAVKLRNLIKKYTYLGSDSISSEWGHFYFGRKKNMNNDFKMLVMAGHGRNVDGTWDPGATGNGYQEADLTRELRDLIKLQADKQGVTCDIAPDRNHYSFFKSGGKYDISKYDYVLEVHFNSSFSKDTIGDGSVKGSMFYIDQSETGHSVEDAILHELYVLGSRQAWDGVVVTQRQYKNGLMVQNHIRAQGVSHAVLETCFMSDRDDMDWYQVNKSKIAAGIVAGIKKGFGLNFEPYMVKVIDPELNIRSGPGTNYPVVGVIKDLGSYTIVKESTGIGANRWGRLKSGAGWISLDYTKR